MKTIFLILMISLLTVPAWAQKDLFGSLTEKYADKDGFSASRITSDMFDLYLKKRNIETDSPVSEALKNLDKILVISQTGFLGRGISHPDSIVQDQNVAQLHKTLLDYYSTNGFTLFKTEKQMGEDVKVFLKKDKEQIESLALVTGSKFATNLVELQGKIDLSTVSDLNKALNLRGLENLYKINSSSRHAFHVIAPDAPGIHFSEGRIDEMVEKQLEMVEKQRHLTDEQRQRIEVQARVMAEKHREFAEKYQRQPIFLSSPGDSTIYYIDGKKVDAEAFKKLSPDDIEKVEVKKEKGKKDKSEIRITTRK